MKPKSFRPHSLKTRVTLFTLIIFTVSIWSLLFYASCLLREDMQRLLGEQQRSTVTLLAQEINHELADRLEALESMAQIITPELLSKPSTLQKQMESHPFFARLFNAGVIVTKLDGVAIVDVGVVTNRVGVNYRNTEAISAALEGRPTIGSPVIGKVLKVPLLGMAVPIKDKQNNIIGVLAGGIDLGRQNFLDNLIQNKYGKTGGYLVVAHTTRLIVTATDKTRIMQSAPAEGENPVIDNFFAGDENTAVFMSPRGIELVGSAKRIPIANWHVTAILPTSEAFEPIRIVQNQMLVSGLLLTLLAGGLTWWMLKRQLSPMLSTIEIVTHSVDSNEMPTALPVKNQDEIGDLVRCFNILLAKLAQREQALKDSEKRFELAIDGAEEGIWDNDLMTGRIYHSPRMREMLGYTLEELPPNFDAWKKIAHPEDWETMALKFDTHLENPKAEYNVTVRFLHKDGTWRWIHIRGKATRDSSGYPLRVTGTHIDITERKILDTELSNVRAKTLVLIDSIPDLIFYKDVNGVYLGCNEAFAELIGRPFGDIIGKTDFDLFPSDFAHFVRNTDKLVLAAQERQNYEEWVRYPDGQRVLLHTIKTPFWSKEEHELQGILGISRNITERYEVEQAIEHAKELAEEATETKSNFLANMSHEIRTPMNAIIGLSYLTMLTKLTPQQHDYLSKIQASSNHLLCILNDILDFSKIEAGKLTIEHADFKFDDVIENLTNLTADRAKEKGLKLFFDIDPHVPKSLSGDALRLGQILINYVNNAIKFTEEGGISISVNVIRETPHNVFLKFSVRDTGIGLTPETKMNLFQCFQQADASTSRKYGGTGLGLAICKQLATLMNGEVGVESEINQGSTFWFTAEIDKSNGSLKAPADCGDTECKEALKTLKGVSILLVEDNEFNQDVMMGLLDHYEFDIWLANNGQEALDMLEQHDFDVVFMDMQMPIMDGVIATLKIRANPRFIDMPIIAMTANARMQDKEKCFAAGMNDYLIKPIYPDELYHMLLKWVQART